MQVGNEFFAAEPPARLLPAGEIAPLADVKSAARRFKKANGAAYQRSQWIGLPHSPESRKYRLKKDRAGAGPGRKEGVGQGCGLCGGRSIPLADHRKLQPLRDLVLAGQVLGQGLHRAPCGGHRQAGGSSSATRGWSVLGAGAARAEPSARR